MNTGDPPAVPASALAPPDDGGVVRPASRPSYAGMSVAAACTALALLLLPPGTAWAGWVATGVAAGLIVSALSDERGGRRPFTVVVVVLLLAAWAGAWLQQVSPARMTSCMAPLLAAAAGAAGWRAYARTRHALGVPGWGPGAVAVLLPAIAWWLAHLASRATPDATVLEASTAIAAGALAGQVFGSSWCSPRRTPLRVEGDDADDGTGRWLPSIASTLLLAALPWLPVVAIPLIPLPLLACARQADVRAVGTGALLLVAAWSSLAWMGIRGDGLPVAALTAAVAHALALAIARTRHGSGGSARLVARLRDELQAVLGRGPAPAAVLDAELRHLSANPAYLRWTGTPGSVVLQRALGDVHGPEAAALVQAARRALAGQPQRAQLERGDGRALDVHLEPRFSPEGLVDGVYLLAQDASWRSMLDTQFASMLEAMPLPTVALDPAGRIQQANAGADALLGLDGADPGLRDLATRLDADAAAALAAALARVRAEPGAITVAAGTALRTTTAIDASPVAEVALRLVPCPSDRAAVALLTLEDLAPARAREHALAQGRTRAEVAIDAIPDAVVACDARGMVVLFNAAAARLCATPPEAALGRALDEVLAMTEPGSDAPAPVAIRPLLSGAPALAPVRKWLLRQDGERRMVSEAAAAVHDRFGQVDGVVVLLHDVTESQAQAQTLAHQAQHDPLTGLPNRVLLRDRLSQALAQLDRGYRGALLYVDLDRFKPINDSLGHPVGDRVLQEVATRLRAGVRQDDTVSRQGGDEFVLLLVRLADPRDAARVADKLIQAIEAPIHVDGHELRVSASIGIALFPQDGRDIAGLTRQADSALYHAKQAGRGRYAYVTDIIGASADERMRLEHDLRIALATNGFELAWQAQVALPDRRLEGVEALVRWRRDDGSLDPAQTFIPVAEETGLVVEIDEWVIATACGQVARWHAEGRGWLPVSVNVSLARFDAERLLACVRTVLARTGLPPGTLEIEFRGVQLFALGTRGQTLLASLRQAGVRVAADDFGSGQASLRELVDCGLDTLKIDQDYVRGLQSGGKARTIIEAVLALGHVMGYRIVAKGIEEEAQLDLLVALGCRHAQGTLLGDAGPASAIQPAIRSDA